MSQKHAKIDSSESSIIARIDDAAIVDAFESLRMRDSDIAMTMPVTSSYASMPTATPVRTLNSVGICDTCRHHHTGCRCTDTHIGKHKGKKGRCVHKACTRQAAYTGIGKICNECDPKKHDSCDACSQHQASSSSSSTSTSKKTKAPDRETDRAFTSITHRHRDEAMDAVRHVHAADARDRESIFDAVMHVDTHHVTMPVLTRAKTGKQPAKLSAGSNAPAKTGSNAPVDGSTPRFQPEHGSLIPARLRERIRSRMAFDLAASAASGNNTPVKTGSNAPVVGSNAPTGSTPNTGSNAPVETAGSNAPARTGSNAPVIGNTASTSGLKRKEGEASVDRQTMLSIIGRHAWQHVLDNSSTFPDVLSFKPSEWLEMLPHDMRNTLSVVHQNAMTAALRLEMCIAKHGKGSAKTAEAGTKTAQEQRTLDDTISLMARIAETMLSAGTRQ